MEFKSSLFAIIIVGILITAVGIIINGWAVEYNSGQISDLDVLNKNPEIQTNVEGMKGVINPQSGEASSDFETTTFRGVYAIVTGKYIWDSFRLIFGDNGMLEIIAERFGLPNYVVAGIISLLIISIIFSLVAIIFRLSRVEA